MKMRSGNLGQNFNRNEGLKLNSEEISCFPLSQQSLDSSMNFSKQTAMLIKNQTFNKQKIV